MREFIFDLQRFGDSDTSYIMTGSGNSYISDASKNILIDAGDGMDTIYFNGGSNNTVLGGAGADSMDSRLANYSYAYVDGGADNDTITGRYYRSSIAGGTGNDVVILKQGGQNTIEGGKGLFYTRPVTATIQLQILIPMIH